MSKPAGYLINQPSGAVGEHGVGYDYVLGSNGLYVQSRSDNLVARIRIAECRVRGLAPVDTKISLRHGLIPTYLFERGLRWFQEEPHTERFFSIAWDGEEYVLQIPDQYGTAASLTYVPPSEAVVEFHSHGSSRAFFSLTDDDDEQGFRIYGVVGRVGDIRSELNLRLGIYGHFAPLNWSSIFDGGVPALRVIIEDTGGGHVPSG